VKTLSEVSDFNEGAYSKIKDELSVEILGDHHGND